MPKILLLFVLALALAGDAPAKSDPPKADRWSQGSETIRNDVIASPRRLCESAKVREEVKITPKQWEELVRLKTERYQQIFDSTQSLANVDDSIRKPISRQIGQMNWQYEVQDVRRVLDAKQVKRLTQLYFQVYDLFTLADPEFQDLFNLNPEQRDEIVAIREQFRDLLKQNIAEEVGWGSRYRASKQYKVTPEEEQAFFKRKAPDFERNFQRANEARAKALREISRRLTKRQRQAFEKMKGEPLDLSRLAEPGDAGRINAEPAKAKDEKK